MPTYIYKCADNGHVFELVQGFNDEPGAAEAAKAAAEEPSIDSSLGSTDPSWLVRHQVFGNLPEKTPVRLLPPIDVFSGVEWPVAE